MLLRCKTCKVLMGLRPPFDDWSIDYGCLCAGCAYVQLDALPVSESAHLLLDEEPEQDVA
jgi:hypothetical protein